MNRPMHTKMSVAVMLAAVAIALLNALIAGPASAASSVVVTTAVLTDTHGAPADGAYIREDIATVGWHAPEGSDEPLITVNQTTTDPLGRFNIVLNSGADEVRSNILNGVINVEIYGYRGGLPGLTSQSVKSEVVVRAEPDGAGGYLFAPDSGQRPVVLELADVKRATYDKNCLATLPSPYLSANGVSARPQVVAATRCALPAGVQTMSFPSEGGDSSHTYPANPCPTVNGPQPTPPPGGVPHKYTTRVHDESIPIIDVSANSGDEEVVTVGSRTTSKLTYGVNLSSNGWKVGGTRTISNSAATEGGVTAKPGRYTTVRSNYRYYDYRTYYCYNTRIDHYDDEISPGSWSGTLYFAGTNDKQALSARGNYTTANSAGRSGFLEVTGQMSSSNTAGRSWTFGMEGVVTLSAEMDYSNNLTLTWRNTTAVRKYYYGTNERPFLARQTYVCDC